MVWQAFAVGSALQLGGGILGSKKADKAAQKAAESQMRMTKLQRTEEIRQMSLGFAQEAGRARLAAFASNVQLSGSTRQYLDTIKSEQRIQLANRRRAAIAEQYAIAAGAKGAGDSVLYAGISSAISTATSAVSAYVVGE